MTAPRKVIEGYSLQCTEGANKFWSGVLVHDTLPRSQLEKDSPWVVILKWGKIGTVGQEDEKRFTREHTAKAYLSGRLRDKERKGYVYVTPSDPHRTTKLAEKPVSTPHVETKWDLF